MKPTKYNYPLAPSKPVTEDYFGTKITDHYRNLEDLTDPIVQKWYKDQGVYAENILENIPGRDLLIQKIEDLIQRKLYSISSVKVTRDDQCFFLKKQKGAETAQVFYRKDQNSEDELLFDPKDYKQQELLPLGRHPENPSAPIEKNYVISNISPSWNGRYLVIAITHSGREISELIILDMNTRKFLPHIITNGFSNVKWFPDSNGFAYTHRPVIDVNSTSLWKDAKVVRYTIGDDPKDLNVFFSKNTHPHLNISSSDFLSINFHDPLDKYIVGFIHRPSPYAEIYYASVEELEHGIPDWKPLLTKEDRASRYGGVLSKDTYIFPTVKNAPNGQIRSTTIGKQSLGESTLLADSKADSIIDDFAITSDGLYFTRVKNGVECKLYLSKDGKEINIPLPKPAGAISLSSIGGRYPDIKIKTSGWVNAETSYKCINNQLIEDDISPLDSYPEFENFVVKEVLVKSHDGEEVPLSIIHQKGIELNGQHPTLMHGYGSHNISIKPSFSPESRLIWVAQGGIYCQAHVRGGGEKGAEWYEAGRKTNKPNTWKDFIACTEYLIKEKYTCKEKMAIRGGSSGGITIGRAITARPDLYAVAISQVGGMNMLRADKSPNPGPIIRDHGNSEIPIECKALIEMDAYLQLQEGVEYPATLITAGMNDPRVSAWQPGKFAAKLQAYNASEKPTIFWVDYESGHGFGNTESKVIKKWANLYSFAFWQLGHPIT